MWYYKERGLLNDYPVGYFTNFSVVTTNTVRGSQIQTYYRTHYDTYYKVFVEYPLDIGCYKNVKILNWYVLFIILYRVMKQTPQVTNCFLGLYFPIFSRKISGCSYNIATSYILFGPFRMVKLQ